MPGTWVYSKVFRWLYGLAGAAFALGFLYSVWKLASDAPVFAPAFYVAAQLLAGGFLGTLGFELLYTKDTETEHSTLGAFRNVSSAVLGVFFVLAALCVLLHLVFWRLPFAFPTR
jgi:hypothetical protein